MNYQIIETGRMLIHYDTHYRSVQVIPDNIMFFHFDIFGKFLVELVSYLSSLRYPSSHFNVLNTSEPSSPDLELKSIYELRLL